MLENLKRNFGFNFIVVLLATRLAIVEGTAQGQQSLRYPLDIACSGGTRVFGDRCVVLNATVKLH